MAQTTFDTPKVTPPVVAHPTQAIQYYLNTLNDSQTKGIKRNTAFITGLSGSGKTYSVCKTAPGVKVLDFDRGLSGIDFNVEYIPFYDPATARMFACTSTPEALLAYLEREATKLDESSTLIIDSMSTLGDAVWAWKEPSIPRGKKGDDDGYWIWKEWAAYWLRLHTIIKDRLRCNVVLTAHEEEVRDAETGKVEAIRWLLRGRQFTPRIPSFWDHVIRARKDVIMPVVGTIKEVKYLWQVQASQVFPSAKSRNPRLSNVFEINADWNELIK